MIVVSLLLILVAVVLLVLGLASGSSPLLISSIVASLLAAVALVIGARQAARQRRAPVYPEPTAARSDFSGSDPILVGGRHSDPDAALRSPEAESALDPDLAEERPAPAATVYPDADGAAVHDFDGRLVDDGATQPMSGPDADAAGPGARAAEIDAHAAGLDGQAAGPDASAAGMEAYAAGMQAHAAGRHDADAALASDPAVDRSLAHEAAPTDPPGRSGDSLETSKVGDPDEDDPADEPPPQTIRPSDAVRVARMDDEVLVVDRRPRYHLGDCSHLAGRHTEPLPIGEAVELGFSPCGQCRPVDRLVARAARG